MVAVGHSGSFSPAPGGCSSTGNLASRAGPGQRRPEGEPLAMAPENQPTTAAERPVAFVHTNAKQRLGALVSARSFRRNPRDPGASDARPIEAEDCAPLRAAEGRGVAAEQQGEPGLGKAPANVSPHARPSARSRPSRSLRKGALRKGALRPIVEHAVFR
ncbi:MAG: hypothetical protein ICV73_12045 [Acetobacteraceae bacterium]|nr:hypothetical protein [Acetobacteraceae bacterium]